MHDVKAMDYTYSVHQTMLQLHQLTFSLPYSLHTSTTYLYLYLGKTDSTAQPARSYSLILSLILPPPPPTTLQDHLLFPPDILLSIDLTLATTTLKPQLVAYYILFKKIQIQININQKIKIKNIQIQFQGGENSIQAFFIFLI